MRLRGRRAWERTAAQTEAARQNLAAAQEGRRAKQAARRALVRRALEQDWSEEYLVARIHRAGLPGSSRTVQRDLQDMARGAA